MKLTMEETMYLTVGNWALYEVVMFAYTGDLYWCAKVAMLYLLM